MAIEAQSDSGVIITHSEELEVLQSILSTQGSTASYEDAATIGEDLLVFFAALGEENYDA